MCMKNDLVLYYWKEIGGSWRLHVNRTRADTHAHTSCIQYVYLSH